MATGKPINRARRGDAGMLRVVSLKSKANMLRYLVICDRDEVASNNVLTLMSVTERLCQLRRGTDTGFASVNTAMQRLFMTAVRDVKEEARHALGCCHQWMATFRG